VGLATVEAGGTAAEATEQVEMTDLSVVRQHRMNLARIRTEPGATGSGAETGWSYDRKWCTGGLHLT
jgi:hypothetical protein